MFRQNIVVFLAVIIFSIASFAQASQGSKAANWEFLEVSSPGYAGSYGQSGKNYRNYNYLTSVTYFAGPSSLDWMKNSGWEIVSVVSVEGSGALFYFKRPFDKTRTENEIARLKRDYETETQTVPLPPKSALTDLDEQEFLEKLANYNKTEEINLRAALEQIKNLSLKVISVQSKTSRLDSAAISSEIVLDATSVLLKDGKNYRSSEAEKFYQDAAKQILETLRLTSSSNPINGNAQDIAKGFSIPQPIGKFSDIYGGFTIMISVVVNTGNEQNIVVQNRINAYRIKEK